jgi:hypothetical protein
LASSYGPSVIALHGTQCSISLWLLLSATRQDYFWCRVFQIAIWIYDVIIPNDDENLLSGMINCTHEHEKLSTGAVSFSRQTLQVIVRKPQCCYQCVWPLIGYTLLLLKNSRILPCYGQYVTGTRLLSELRYRYISDKSILGQWRWRFWKWYMYSQQDGSIFLRTRNQELKKECFDIKIGGSDEWKYLNILHQFFMLTICYNLLCNWNVRIDKVIFKVSVTQQRSETQ